MPVVKFYAHLRKLAGAKEKMIAGNSIREVVENLVDGFPELRPFFHKDNEAYIRAIITLNGHTLERETALDVPVTEQDQIAIFPPISGG
jgi:MoaD family protein